MNPKTTWPAIPPFSLFLSCVRKREKERTRKKNAEDVMQKQKKPGRMYQLLAGTPYRASLSLCCFHHPPGDYPDAVVHDLDPFDFPAEAANELRENYMKRTNSYRMFRETLTPGTCLWIFIIHDRGTGQTDTDERGMGTRMPGVWLLMWLCFRHFSFSGGDGGTYDCGRTEPVKFGPEALNFLTFRDLGGIL